MPPVVSPTGQTRVNTTTANNQDEASVARLAQGGWIVTWTSFDQDGSGDGIYQQRYAANGTKVGNETLVNTTTNGSQTRSSVTALANGGWLVTWTSLDQDGGLDWNVYQQLYNANGNRVGGETLVSNATVNAQVNPDVVALSDGGWLAVWQSSAQDGSGQGIYQQRFSANGNKVGAETQVNTYTTDDQHDPSITKLNDGGWVVTWTSLGQDGSGFGIYQQRYATNGDKVGGETLVNTFTTGAQYYSSVSALADGGWLVTWASNAQDGSQEGIYQQRYAANGTRIGGETLVNTHTAEEQKFSHVTDLADGGWLVTWTSTDQDGHGEGVYQQRYAANGGKVGGEIRVNTYTDWDQNDPSVIGLSDGGWLVVWHSDDEDGTTDGIYQQRFTAEGQPVGPTTPWGLNLSGILVKEGAGISTPIGDAVVKAFDTSQGFTYALVDDAGGRFALSGNQLVVKNGVALDFEQARSHQVGIEARDALGATYRKWLTVTVADVTSENLTGTAGDDVLKGGRYKDTFKGGAGNDRLWGGLGNDVLSGGTGRDTFVFDTKPHKKTNLDRIVDFVVKDDTIWLDNKVFTKLGKGAELKPGKLNKAFFTLGDKAKDKNDYLVFTPKTGVLSYDIDGSGAKAAIDIAVLKKGLKLTYADFLVI